MSEQWYCTQCGPVTNARPTDTGHMSCWNCPHCPNIVTTEFPPFVLAMQSNIKMLNVRIFNQSQILEEKEKRIAELVKVAEAVLVELCDVEGAENSDLVKALREAGYGGGEMTNGGTMTSTVKPVRYSLMLNYTSEFKPGIKGTPRKWSLWFQTSPVQDVILTGDEPTTGEIMRTLVNTQLPIIFLPMCESIIAMILRNRKTTEE